MTFSLRRVLFGSPLPSERAAYERLPIVLALPIFASDALSSVAYATEAILRKLDDLDVRAEDLYVTLGVSLAIVALILLVVTSYTQVIRHYPRGGGSYMVARQNLGLIMGLIAASALLVEYVLTVAVSVAECVAQANSALMHLGGVWAQVDRHKVSMASALVLLIVLANLRGVRQSGALFAAPTYGFMIITCTMILTGVYRVATGLPPADPVAAPPDPAATQSATWLVAIRGFASGCAALTGIEAISNGVTYFRKPEARNATITLVILGGFLAFMFTGISYLAVAFRIGPSDTETVVSQIARACFGTEMPFGVLYIAMQLFATLILFLAANTVFNSFPRLTCILAEDGFLPRQFATLGDRLAYNNGIILLGLTAVLFLIAFRGETHALLPLYTIGVFVAFTTAQFGLVWKQGRLRPVPWGWFSVNLVGGLVTLMVLCVVTSTKFVVFDVPPMFGTTWLYEGAWMVVVMMVLIVLTFLAINRHYGHTDEQLSVTAIDDRPFRHTVIVLVPARIHRGVLQALHYARSISPNAVALHVAFEQSRAEDLQKEWEERSGGTPLIVLDSPYRSLVGPVMDYLDAAERVRDDDVITVVLPEFVPSRWWHNVLHNASGWLLRLRLHYRRDIVVTSVRYYLD